MTIEFEYELCIDEYFRDVKVMFNVIPEEKGSRELNTGLKLEPDIKEMIEDIEIFDINTEEFLDIPENLYNELEEACKDHLKYLCENSF